MTPGITHKKGNVWRNKVEKRKIGIIINSNPKHLEKNRARKRDLSKADGGGWEGTKNNYFSFTSV